MKCICGAEIVQHDGKGRPAKFCSERCRVAAHRAKHANNVTDDSAQDVTKVPRGGAPFPWFGGKQKLAPLLVSLLPVHDVYVEVFGGAASLLWAKQTSPLEVYNDLDSGLVNFFSVLRNPLQALELQRSLDLTPYSREEWHLCARTWEEAPDDLEKARRWFVALCQGFSKCSDMRQHGWGFSCSSARHAVHSFRSYSAALPQFCDRLALVQIEHGDFERIFTIYDRTEALFYCDPPYLPDTRRRLDKYANEMSLDDHKRLLQTITSAKGKVILSGYDSDLYAQVLQDWECIKTSVWNTSSKIIREKRTECIWLSPNIARQPTLWEVS